VTDTATAPPAPRLQRQLVVGLVRYGMFIALALWLVAMSLASEYFLTWTNLLNVLRQAAPLIIIGVGMTFVMATAGIDLSVGSTVALISVLTASWIALGVPALLVIPLVLIVGVAIGAFNGWVVTLGVPAFVVTLAGLTSIRGLAFVYSDGYATPISDPVFVWIGRGDLFGINAPFLIAMVVAVAGWFLLNRTRFGLHALATGGREEAARVMGLAINRVKMLVYALTGGLAALGGIVISARLSNGSPNAGVMLELEVIAAVVLGGTSLFGGRATIAGTVVGALLINFVRNGLNLLGVNPYWVQVVTGIILVNLFALGLGWFSPTSSVTNVDSLLDWVNILFLPAVTASFVLVGYVTRMARAGMIEELKKPYVRTATLKGLSRRNIINKHVLRNALLPTITVIAISVGWLMGGIVVIENVFNYPGLGQELVKAVEQKNIPMLQAITVIIVFVFAISNLVADIVYAFLNPRIRQTYEPWSTRSGYRSGPSSERDYLAWGSHGLFTGSTSP